MDAGRRQFLKICGTGAFGASAIAFGFAPTTAKAGESRQYKLLRARETRNNCTYCSVGSGILMYGLGDGAKNAKADIFHIEGDPDHPVSRGSLCPKGAGLIDFIHSEQRLKYPEYRPPGSDLGPRRAITWRGATIPTFRDSAAHRVGHGPGRKTGAFCTIAHRPISREKLGIPLARSWSGQENDGKGSMPATTGNRTAWQQCRAVHNASGRCR